ncbi:neocarzinostatin apoprotein domain-containing protein [Actinocorallia aurea]
MKISRLAALTGAAVLLFAPSASAAAAQLSISKTSGLAAGDVVTVNSLTGLTPNLASVAVGQCLTAVKGPNDCNLTGSLLGKADASGKWVPPAKGNKITIVKTVGGKDCTVAGTCIIGVTSLMNPSNIITKVAITFGSSGSGSGTGTGTGTGTGDGTGTGTGTGDGTGTLPQTGSPDGIPTFALAASALVLTGAALLFLLPRRRTSTDS